MTGIKIITLGIAGFILLSSNALADDRRNVEYMLPGCRFQALNPPPVQDSEWTQALICRDALESIVKNGPLQPVFLNSCVPENIPPHRIAQAVVEFLERDVNRLRERFDIRATAALHSVWPCH